MGYTCQSRKAMDYNTPSNLLQSNNNTLTREFHEAISHIKAITQRSFGTRPSGVNNEEIYRCVCMFSGGLAGCLGEPGAWGKQSTGVHLSLSAPRPGLPGSVIIRTPVPHPRQHNQEPTGE